MDVFCSFLFCFVLFFYALGVLDIQYINCAYSLGSV